MIAIWRILGGGIYLLSAYVLFRIVVPIRFRKVVFLLFLCAQPLSTFTVDLLKDHYEVWVWHFGEAARRISAMPPHYTVGKGLTVLSIGLFLTYFAKKKPIILFASCISGFVAGLIYPPPVFILISSMVLGTVVYGGVHWKEKKEMSEFILKNAFPIGIFFLFVCMPLGLLKLELSKGYPWNLWNKVELGWNDPKMMFELDYARQLGLLLGLVPFAFISLFLKKNNRSWYECFVFIWSISAFLFFPFANALQLGKFRFTEGAQIIPLAIVALWGSEFLFRKSIRLKKVALSLFIFYFGVFTFLVARDSTIALNGYWRNVYIQPEELSVLNYLDSHATKDTIIVADVFSANYIPAFARVKTTTGFPDFFESYEKFLRIYQLTDKFFLRELTDTQAYELLKEQKADYVYYLNYVYGDVTIYPSFLEKVNGNSGIVLYKVKKSL
jgi:hypothetical protein